MNDGNEKNQGSGFKYFLFLGIPVIIILTVLGAYYYTTNPKLILTTTIEKSFETLNNILNNQNALSKIDKPFALTGNINLKLEENNNSINLEQFDFNYEIEVDKTKEYLSFLLGINEEEKNILNLKLFQLEQKQFLISEKLFDGILDITDNNNTENFSILKKKTLDIENSKIMLQKFKNILLETIDEKYIAREKTDLLIQNEKIKTTKVSYLLDEENQEKTIEKMKEKILNDDEFLEILSEIKNTDQEDIEKMLQDYQFNYKNDIEIAIYTEGLKQNVIQYSIIENNQNLITYSNYHEKTLNINNEITLKFEDWTKEHIEIEYHLLKEDITGNIDIKLNENIEQDKKENLVLTLKKKNLSIRMNLNNQLQIKEEIKIPDTTNAKPYQSLTEQELNEFMLKLEDILKTILYSFTKNSI